MSRGTRIAEQSQDTRNSITYTHRYLVGEGRKEKDPEDRPENVLLSVSPCPERYM